MEGEKGGDRHHVSARMPINRADRAAVGRARLALPFLDGLNNGINKRRMDTSVGELSYERLRFQAAPHTHAQEPMQPREQSSKGGAVQRGGLLQRFEDISRRRLPKQMIEDLIEEDADRIQGRECT